MDAIKEIEKQIDEKYEQIKLLEDELRELRRRLLPLKTGLNEGDVVINKMGVKGVICFNGIDTYWWGVRKLKKDGTPSERVQIAFPGDGWKKADGIG
jgi:hypothetical protein